MLLIKMKHIYRMLYKLYYSIIIYVKTSLYFFDTAQQIWYDITYGALPFGARCHSFLLGKIPFNYLWNGGYFMQKKLTLTKLAYEELVAHLVNFEERRKYIINLYFPEYNRQREEFEELINSYISALDDIVGNVSFSEKSENDFPFVCLNSVVEIEDVEQTEKFSYRLIEPETINNGTDCVTILSPMGKALLCKKEGETVSVNTPTGVYRYRIKSIRLQ